MDRTELTSEVTEALRNLRARIDTLPELPRECPCGCSAFHVTTDGVAQVCDARWSEGGEFMATTDGWDDIAGLEGSDLQFASCQECETAYRLPERINWN